MSLYILVPLTALVPLFVGFIWYNPKVFGTAWMTASGMTMEKAQGSNMPLIFGLTYFVSLFICLGLMASVIHQAHFLSIVANDMKDPSKMAAAKEWLDKSMELYGNHFRTFRHGVIHGIILSILIVLPVITINALFERRGFKYIAINTGYFIVCFAIMGGIICQFAKL